MNPLRHGYRSQAWRQKAQRIRRAIRLCAETVLLARVLTSQRDRDARMILQDYGIPFPSVENGGLNCRDAGLGPTERQFAAGSVHVVSPACGR
jgi:hypothetical protein